MAMRMTTSIISPPLQHQDMIGISQQEAIRRLAEFCKSNGFAKPARYKAFRMFRSAVKVTGRPYTVNTANISAVAAVRRAHNCMEAVTTNPVAHDLAIIAFDAMPGSRFVHSSRGDFCQLTVVVTNEPASS